MGVSPKTLVTIYLFLYMTHSDIDMRSSYRKKTSCLFVASVYGIPLVVRIHGNFLQQYLVVDSLEYRVTTNNSNIL